MSAYNFFLNCWTFCLSIVDMRGGAYRMFWCGFHSRDLLCPVKSWVTQALSGGNVTDAVKTVAAVILTVIPISPVGTAHLTPTDQGDKTGMNVVYYGHCHISCESCLRTISITWKPEPVQVQVFEIVIIMQYLCKLHFDMLKSRQQLTFSLALYSSVY